MSEDSPDPVVDNSFYEQNAQCWRCRMYVPRVEMKYHAGMLYCPICYNDVAEAGGRCQLCGRQLESDEQQYCHECSERKKGKQKCPHCGSQMEEGTCPRCSRGEGGEEGKRCPRCGSQFEGEMCPRCSRGEPFEAPSRCPVCGTRLEAGSCPKCSWEPQGKPPEDSSGLVNCSKCRQPAKPAIWNNSQPYCRACYEQVTASIPLRVVRGISGTLRGLVKPKADSRVKVKAKQEKEENKTGEQ